MNAVRGHTPLASDGTSPSGSHSGIPTGSETAPDGLAPSGAHGSKLRRSLSYHQDPDGLAPSGESGSQANTHYEKELPIDQPELLSL